MYIPSGDIVFSAVGTAINNTTTISLIGAAGANYQYFVQKVLGSNLSTAVDTQIKIYDGTAVRDTLPLPRGDSNVKDYGEIGVPYTTGNAISIQSESSADSRFTVMGYKKRV